MPHQVGLGGVRKSYAPSGWAGWSQEELCSIRLGWVESGRAMPHQFGLGGVRKSYAPSGWAGWSQEEQCHIGLDWVE